MYESPLKEFLKLFRLYLPKISIYCIRGGINLSPIINSKMWFDHYFVVNNDLNEDLKKENDNLKERLEEEKKIWESKTETLEKGRLRKKYF